MRSLLLAVVAVFAFLAIGCGPRWVVVRQAAPNPMGPESRFFVDRPSFENLSVGEKTEESYQASKDNVQQESWKQDKAGFQEEFASGFAEERERVGIAAAPTDGFVVKPHVVWIEPGFYALAARPTEVRMSVVILDPRGAPLDEITIHSAIPATLTNPSSGGRLRDAGKYLGKVVALYLKKRAGLD